MVFILQGTSRIGQHSASMQVFESLSMEMETNPKFAAKSRAQIIASASAWRGRVVFTLLDRRCPSSICDCEHLDSIDHVVPLNLS